MLLKVKPWIKNERKEKIRKYLEINENENVTLQNQWDAAKVCMKEVHNDRGLPEETRKISSKQSNLPPKQIWKKRPKNSRVSRRKEILKLREEINKVEIKKLERINKIKNWFVCLFEINIIDKPPASFTKKIREKTKRNKQTENKKIRNERGEIITNSMNMANEGRVWISIFYRME